MKDGELIKAIMTCTHSSCEARRDADGNYGIEQQMRIANERDVSTVNRLAMFRHPVGPMLCCRRAPLMGFSVRAKTADGNFDRGVGPG